MLHKHLSTEYHNSSASRYSGASELRRHKEANIGGSARRPTRWGFTWNLVSEHDCLATTIPCTVQADIEHCPTGEFGADGDAGNQHVVVHRSSFFPERWKPMRALPVSTNA